MSSIHSQSETTETKNAEACPVVEAIEQIGSQWRLIILHDLHGDGEKRFNELQRSTDASSRTLSRVLDDLEEVGLVNRRVEDKPIATYYSLTEKSRQLCPVFAELEGWADEWVETCAAEQ
ncbi:winged helix-turn-helix transcriptional regulator [Halorussus pelagicus]|uniref:winged helix-turn-helix transcriptional regulator n=1 Tax=Halorussus pelagicus TaxID=2505977 RepID=UPI000FFC4E5C|nr:helix-turn-helix domain-containing protein [Halorussus pelagicus]